MCQMIAAAHSYRRVRLFIDSIAPFLTPETIHLILSTVAGNKYCVQCERWELQVQLTS